MWWSWIFFVVVMGEGVPRHLWSRPPLTEPCLKKKSVRGDHLKNPDKTSKACVKWQLLWTHFAASNDHFPIGVPFLVVTFVNKRSLRVESSQFSRERCTFVFTCCFERRCFCLLHYSNLNSHNRPMNLCASTNLFCPVVFTETESPCSLLQQAFGHVREVCVWECWLSWNCGPSDKKYSAPLQQSGSR